MRKVGANATRMDVLDQFMAPAAMVAQGCYDSPNACYQVNPPGYSVYTTNCEVPVSDSSLKLYEGYGVLQETFYQGNFEHTEQAYAGAGSVSATVKEAFFPFDVPTSGYHYAACGLVGDPGFAFAVFYWWAYDYLATHSVSACELVGIYDTGSNFSALQYSYAKGLTSPCKPTTSACTDYGACAYIT